MGRRVIFLLSVVLSIAPAYALRCGSDLVSVDDRPIEVLHKCGEPDYVEEWVEHKYYRDYYHDHLPLYRDVYGPVKIEEWTYNFGRNSFMQLLHFENGKLKNIRSLGYGY